MRRLWSFAAALGALGVIYASSVAGEGTEVTLDGLKSRTPASWKMQKPASRLRTHQFQLPHADGDGQDAELAIFFFGAGSGGSAAENVKRWKGQFQPPEGKTIEDVSKLDKFKVGNVEVTYLDVHGTYLFRDPSNPKAKVDPMPGFRRFGIIFASENGPYFITLTGPAKTMEKHKKD